MAKRAGLPTKAGRTQCKQHLSDLFSIGVIPISGVYDLRPIIETYINDPLRMDE